MRTKIEVRALSKSFDSDKGRLNVVEDVSFTVRDGEFIAIVGLRLRPNGAHNMWPARPARCGRGHHDGVRAPSRTREASHLQHGSDFHGSRCARTEFGMNGNAPANRCDRGRSRGHRRPARLEQATARRRWHAETRGVARRWW